MVVFNRGAHIKPDDLVTRQTTKFVQKLNGLRDIAKKPQLSIWRTRLVEIPFVEPTRGLPEIKPVFSPLRAQGSALHRQPVRIASLPPAPPSPATSLYLRSRHLPFWTPATSHPTGTTFHSCSF